MTVNLRSNTNTGSRIDHRMAGGFRSAARK